MNIIANKFEPLKEIVFNHMDISVIEERKLNDTFPRRSFKIPG